MYVCFQYPDLKTLQNREYVLCLKQLFPLVKDVDEKTLSTQYQKYRFEMILQGIDACIDQDPEAKALLKVSEPSIRDVSTSKIMRYQAYQYVLQPLGPTPRL